jgi:hypothetical protein
MRPAKPERDRLLDETLALVTTAISGSFSANRVPLSQPSYKFAVGHAQDLVVEDMLSLIAQVSHGALRSEGAREAEHRKLTDDISRGCGTRHPQESSKRF